LAQCLMAQPLPAKPLPKPAPDTFRIATYKADLSRFGPGILLTDLRRPNNKQIEPLIEVLLALNADVLLITDIDYDARLLALTALSDRLEQRGLSYPYRFALAPNSGAPTGLDLNGDGALGTPDDTQGYGRFAGEGGMALLSRFPIDTAAVRDFTDFLWRDLPGQIMPPTAPQAAQVQRLSSTGHWDVPIILPGGATLHLLAYGATPPVFDGPEDRNGRRNHDEAAFWLAYLAGRLTVPPPDGPLVILGNSNLDPADGEGRRGAVTALLTHPRLQDPAPKGTADRTEPAQIGDAALDTAFYATGAGGLRVDILLPSRDLTVSATGVLWPPESDPFAQTLAAASRHRPVWADLILTLKN
jgi:hypothetical protein